MFLFQLNIFYIKIINYWVCWRATNRGVADNLKRVNTLKLRRNPNVTNKYIISYNLIARIDCDQLF